VCGWNVLVARRGLCVCNQKYPVTTMQLWTKNPNPYVRAWTLQFQTCANQFPANQLQTCANQTKERTMIDDIQMRVTWIIFIAIQGCPISFWADRSFCACWLSGPWPRFNVNLAKQIPTLLDLSAPICKAQTEVSPEVVWGDVGTKFLHLEMVVMWFCALTLPSCRLISLLGLIDILFVIGL